MMNKGIWEIGFHVSILTKEPINLSPLIIPYILITLNLVEIHGDLGLIPQPKYVA
jgi:hypothetical protein